MLADFTGDGHLDLLGNDGALLEGRGDGTFLSIRLVNIPFFIAAAATNFDRDGLVDVVFTGYSLDATPRWCCSTGRRPVPTSRRSPTIFRDVTVTYSDQFIEDELELTPTRSCVESRSVTYRWLDASGTGDNGGRFPICCRAIGTCTLRSSCATIAAPKAGARRR